MVISDEKILEPVHLELKLLEGLKNINPDDLVEVLKDGLAIKVLKCWFALVLFSIILGGISLKELSYVTGTTEGWVYRFLNNPEIKESLRIRKKNVKKLRKVKKGGLRNSRFDENLVTYRLPKMGRSKREEDPGYRRDIYSITYDVTEGMSECSELARHTGDMQPIFLKKTKSVETKFMESDIIKLWAPIIKQTVERVIDVIRLNSPDIADKWASELQPLTAFSEYASDISEVVKNGISAFEEIPNEEISEWMKNEEWQKDPLTNGIKEKEKLWDAMPKA